MSAIVDKRPSASRGVGVGADSVVEVARWELGLLTERNVVLQSINSVDGGRCVDIFRRPDDTFGFEEFRRDVEDARGWFPIGGFGNRAFVSEDVAQRAARASVPWLRDITEEG